MARFSGVFVQPHIKNILAGLAACAGGGRLRLMDFSVVTRAHVEQALHRLRAGEVVEGFGVSIDYDLVDQGMAFAPKQVKALGDP